MASTSASVLTSWIRLLSTRNGHIIRLSTLEAGSSPALGTEHRRLPLRNSGPLDLSGPQVDRDERSTSHQRKSFCVKPLVGALPVVCPCIAVIGVGPTACNRVGQTTGGAAHDERRGNRGSSMPRGARPSRQLESRSGGWLDHLGSAAGGDRRIPFLACGHDRV